MNNLALVLLGQGKYEEAEEMHRQTLELREKVLGREHPDTPGSMNNLALVLESQGKYEEAEYISA
jgi:Flp pilus assembly protein TadD